ncbi:MAG: signal peptidase I [Erysipelotrichaceae bacterium]|nr:signal peptidase I [Erysipelotrichaceae bacterium]
MKKFLKLLLDILECVAIALVIVFILLRFVLVSVEVMGSSMEPGLVTGDRGVSFILSRNNIERFEICVIESDKTTSLLVKRVIGLPNETVEYIDNKLYINGEYVEEDFLKDTETNDFRVELGEDEYFCMGDNRKVSRDSRYYGSFSKEEIKSCGLFIYYPVNHFGIKD